MSEVMLSEILRCSSEDVNSPSSNLLKNTSGKWLCSKDNRNDSAEIEILLSKAITISYIDIGNNGSHFVDVLIRHSLRNDEFVSIIPTFTFMSVQESKQNINRCKVEMFNKDRMMADVCDKKWDVVKVVCRQPFNSTSQYGLSFIKIKGISKPTTAEQVCTNIATKPQVANNQSALKSFFGFNDDNSSTPPKGSKLNLKSPILNKRSDGHHLISPKTSKLAEEVKTPQPKRTMSPSQQAQFILEVEDFLKEIRFVEKMKSSQFLVSELRHELEEKRGKPLVRQQKKIFMMILTELSADNDKNNNEQLATLTSKSLERKCENCNVMIPTNVWTIHQKICTSDGSDYKVQRQNRKSICFDSISEIDDDTPRKRKLSIPKSTPTSSSLTASKVCKRSGSFSLGSETPTSSNRRKRSGSYSTIRSPSNSSIPDLEIDDNEDPFLLSSPTLPGGNTSQSFPLRHSQADSTPPTNKQSNKYNNHANLISIPETSDAVNGLSKLIQQPKDTKKYFTEPNNVIPTSERHSRIDDETPRNIAKHLPTVIHDKVAKSTKQGGQVNSISIDVEESSWKGKISGVKEDTSSESVKNFSEPPRINLTKESSCASAVKPTDASLVECPLCFRMINEKWITTHAATCQGQTALVTDTSNESNSGETTQACPICQDQISVYRIGIHAMFCKEKVEKIVHEVGNDGDDDLPSVLNTKPAVTAASSYSKSIPQNTSSSVDETVQCPICSANVEKPMIDVHVNMCLDKIT